MVEIAMRRQGARLIPVDEIGADDLVRVPADRDVLVKITSQRNMKLFRFLWALASKVADACDHLHDREDAMDYLKISVRYVRYITNPATGEVQIVPKSLTKLDGAGLSRLADRMIYIICRDIVPGLSESALRSEIMAMIEGPNSNSSQPSPSLVEAETKPASGSASPSPSDAGATSHDWRAIYLDHISKPSDSPKSLLTRHTEALKEIGGEPTEVQLKEMRRLYGLRQRNMHGELSKADYDLAIRELADG